MDGSLAALLRVAAIIFIREKADERAQQKRTKSALEAVSPFERGMFQQVKEKFLREVLGLGFVVAAQTDELMKRQPIPPAQLLKGLPSGALTVQRGARQQAPVC